MKIERAESPPNRTLLNVLAQVCSGLVAVIGLLAILGWLSGNLILAGYGAPVPMAPSTALLFVGYGSTVFLRIRNPHSSIVYRAGIILGLTGTLAAILLFFLSFQRIYLTVEHLGIPISGTAQGVPLGHMSPLTAFCFVLASLSFLAVLSSPPKL